MKVFILSYSHYEEYTPYLFFGPDSYTKESFVELTDSLLDVCVEKCINDEKSKDFLAGWIGWHCIVNQMKSEILNYGFTPIEPICSDYWGSSIIRKESDAKGWQYGNFKGLSEKSTKSLITYNKNFEEYMETEEYKMKMGAFLPHKQ